MTKFQKWVFTAIVSKQVVQGHNHRENILEMYKLIRCACECEFFEDSDYELDCFLKELFTEANKKPTADEFQELWNKINSENKGLREYELAKLIYEGGKEQGKKESERIGGNNGKEKRTTI